MKKKIHLWAQHCLPQHLLSRWVGKLANSSLPWWKNLFIKTFIKMYQVEMSEAAQSDPEQYRNFNDFFTRALKPGLRPIVAGSNQLASPVDGFVSQIGLIQDEQVLQAKNFNYTLTTLLANSTEFIQYFTNGAFATLYLAPKNYHRVHMPITGKLRHMIYVPGRLFSVNANTAENIQDLFALNERVITIFETEIGLVAIILVGAMIVASIETVWAGTIAPSTTSQVQQWTYETDSIILQKGDELGRFKLGSTVIVLIQKDKVSWENFAAGQTLKLGQLLGTLKS